MPEAPDRAEFRPDIEGLRGLAVGLVVLFHAGLGGLGGGFIGVDVFFVISGFLITSLLLRERERTGTIAFAVFYARRLRRLAPAALVVLILSLIMANALWAPLDRPVVLLDGAAAAGSLANVRFALSAGDYFAAVGTPSPFLHFWSLSVEEQFYLVWPLLLLLASRTVRPRRSVGLVLLVLTALSFVLSLWLTEAAANWAFYALPARAYQLGTGGLLAVAAGALARRPAPRLLAWAGLGLIGASAVLIDPAAAYPGWLGLLPVAGAVALLAGRPMNGAGRLLSLAPLRFLGRISYSLYLWHWPVLVFGGVLLGPARTIPGTVSLVALSLVLASASCFLIEEPFRRPHPSWAGRPRAVLAVGTALLLSVIVAASSLAAATTAGLTGPATARATPEPSLDFAHEPSRPASQDPASVPSIDPSTRPEEPAPEPIPTEPPNTSFSPSGGPSSGPTDTPTAGPVSYALPANVAPSLATARDDKERLWQDGCLAYETVSRPANCVYGDTSSKTVVALVGDSHGSYWFPAFEAMALRHHWKLVVFVKVSCPFLDVPVYSRVLQRTYTECATFRDATIERLTALAPALTVVAMSHWIFPVRVSDDNYGALSASFGRVLGRMPGRQVVVLLDGPHAKADVPACLSANRADIRVCATSRSTAFATHGALEQPAAAAAGVATIDLSSSICPADPCPAVVNGMIVYRDYHHLTRTFARSLAPALDRALEPYWPL